MHGVNHTHRLTLKSNSRVTLISTMMLAVLGITLISMHSNVLASPNTNDINGGSIASTKNNEAALMDGPSTINLAPDSDSGSDTTTAKHDNNLAPDSGSGSDTTAAKHNGTLPDNTMQGRNARTGHIEGKPQLEYYDVCINNHCYNYHHPQAEED
jgi:hypothetical protein